MEIIEWWFSYSKLTMLTVTDLYMLIFDWFDNESIGNVVFAVDTVDIRCLVEVLKDTELVLDFDITADLRCSNSMDCVSQPLVLEDNTTGNKPLAFRWLILTQPKKYTVLVFGNYIDRGKGHAIDDSLPCFTGDPAIILRHRT